MRSFNDLVMHDVVLRTYLPAMCKIHLRPSDTPNYTSRGRVFVSGRDAAARLIDRLDTSPPIEQVTREVAHHCASPACSDLKWVSMES